MRTLTILLSIIVFGNSYGQTHKRNCDCEKPVYPYLTKKDTSFYFSNGKTISLCNYKYKVKGKPSYVQFSLFGCTQDNDYVSTLTFWNSERNCKVHFLNDTLNVYESKNLPTGKNFGYRQTVWTSTYIYSYNKGFLTGVKVNKNIRKYNESEIDIVLNEYEKRKPGHFKRKDVLLGKIFMATISGNQTARKYFAEFKDKFAIHAGDGTYAEQLNDLIDMLEEWDAE